MGASQARRHYERAPITEALIDIQTESPLSTSLETLDRFASRLKHEFPTRLPIYQLQMGFQIQIGEQPEFSKEQQILGYRLDRPGRVLQVRTNGFTYSHLPPYSDWETFSAEAEQYWAMFVEDVAPTRANRMAVRVINRVPMPKDDTRLDACLNLFPSLPESLPSDVQSIFMQLQLPMKDVDPDAVVILGLYSALPVPNETAIMLDIDFAIQRSAPINGVFQTINVIGAAKDVVFEACITDKIRELIA